MSRRSRGCLQGSRGGPRHGSGRYHNRRPDDARGDHQWRPGVRPAQRDNLYQHWITLAHRPQEQSRKVSARVVRRTTAQGIDSGATVSVRAGTCQRAIMWAFRLLGGDSATRACETSEVRGDERAGPDADQRQGDRQIRWMNLQGNLRSPAAAGKSAQP